MKKFFRSFVDFISHIKAFFKPYEEELMMGFDVEKLINDPKRQLKVEHMLTINHKKTLQLTDRYNQFMNEYVVIQRIADLPSDLSRKIQTMCKQYSELSVVKEEMEKSALEAEYKEHPTIGVYAKDIPKAIKILKDHEANQQNVKHDLSILEGEKQDLLYHFRNLRRSLAFLKSFLIFLVFASMVSAIVLSTMLLKYNADVFVPSLVTIVIIAFLFIWAYVFRRYCNHELKKNQLMQERAVKLINKTKIKYVHNQQLLDFQYKKYNVNSSEVLELRYDNYLQAKEEERNFDNVNRSMKNIVIDLDRQLTRLHIENTDFLLRNIDFFSTAKGIHSLHQKYEEGRIEMQHELKVLEHEQEVLQSIS